MSFLDSSGMLEAFDRRLALLAADTPRRWGSMTSHEMLCHLSDSFRGMLRERETSPAPAYGVQRQLVRFIALHTPLPWPKGVPTRPEVNPHDKGSRPVAFDTDREAMRELMHRFARPGVVYAPHPMFGALTRREWMRWGFRHVDHHFRQFGI